jgi:COMPASS component BRE2
VVPLRRQPHHHHLGEGLAHGEENVTAREGREYYEVKILKGIPVDGPLDLIDPKMDETKPGRTCAWVGGGEAPLDGPVGFNGYSYGITDARFEAQHRSRASKIFKPLPKGAKSKHMKPRAPHGKPMPVEYVTDQHIQEGGHWPGDPVASSFNTPQGHRRHLQLCSGPR